MHAYDVSSRSSYPSIPVGRTAQDNPGGPSATPIYDALYAEYVRNFRTLPGDRSGEEKLGFTAFGNLPPALGSYTSGLGSYGLGNGSFSSSYSAYSAGANSARQGGGQPSQWQRVGQIGQQGQAGQMGQVGQVGQMGQQGAMQHLPAVLPPGPRRGM
ncbi:hypothetical protein ACFXAZ_35010 [Streptomyces sp. NPDC059477]|uniref:hypothetical protein n=1 Tax=Streptomyces sp. NPDC059477 TaxID=3346847 RepID=UPI0036B8C533